MEASFIFLALALLLAVIMYKTVTLASSYYTILTGLIDCLALILSLGLFAHKKAKLMIYAINPKLILLCLASVLLFFSYTDWSTIRTLLIILQAFVLVFALSEERRASGPSSDVSGLKSRTLNERQPIIDLLFQGYLLYQKVTIPGQQPYTVSYANKKAKDIIQSFHCTFDVFPDNFVLIDQPDQTLSSSLSHAFEDNVPAGVSFKSLVRPAKYKRRESNSEACGSPNDNNKLKACPFNTFKTQIVKVNKSTVILRLTEYNIASQLLTENVASTIVCTLSHEIKTLLNGIVGNLELLDIPYHRDTQYKVSHKIATCSASLLVNKLNDLFDYLLLQNKDFKLHCKEFEIEELVKEVYVACAWLAKQKQTKFEIVKEKPLSRTMIGDKERLTQIILSMTSKAIEFTDYDSVKLIIGVTKEKKIVFKVRSQGTSMLTKLEQHIKNLSPTSRGRSRTSSSESPMMATHNLEALSLQISQLICKEMGTNLVMKHEGTKYVELKFVVKDGFPSPRLHAIPTPGTGEKPRRYSNEICPGKDDNIVISDFSECVNKELVKEAFNKTHYKLKPALAACNEGIDSRISHGGRKYTEDIRITVTKVGDSVSPEREIPSELDSTNKISLPLSPRKRLLTCGGFSARVSPNDQLPEETKKDSLKSPVQQRTPRTRLRRITGIEHIEQPMVPKNTFVDDVSRCRVLVVDDDTFNRYVLKGLLKKYGLNSIEANDGKEAVQLVERYLKTGTLEELSLVFMDLQMPVMNGIQAVNAICILCKAEKCENPTIIGISSDPKEEDRRKFFRAGLTEFISKPITTEKIKRILSKYCRKRIQGLY